MQGTYTVQGAENKGRSDRKRGLSRNANPYSTGTSDWRAWDHGFMIEARAWLEEMGN